MDDKFVRAVTEDIRKLVAQMPGEDRHGKLVAFLSATLGVETGYDPRRALHHLAAVASAVAGRWAQIHVLEENTRTGHLFCADGTREVVRPLEPSPDGRRRGDPRL